MNIKKILSLIEEGESTTLEFKRKIASALKLAKEVAAFANTKGGKVIIGVEDNGKVVGVDSDKSEINLIEEACHFLLSPPIEYTIEVLDISGKDVVLLEIPESKNKPHFITLFDEETKKQYKRVYIRVGENSVIASGEMARLMLYSNEKNNKSLKISIGDKEKTLFSYLEKNHRITVKEYAKLVNISRRRAERILISLVRTRNLIIAHDSDHDYFSLV